MRAGSFLAIVISLNHATVAYAYEVYGDALPNTYDQVDDEDSTRNCLSCHVALGGGLSCETTGGVRPCLNGFGGDFAQTGRAWTKALADLDSDSDGFSNGQELQDALGAWLRQDPPPGNPLQVTAPGDDASYPGAFGRGSRRRVRFWHRFGW